MGKESIKNLKGVGEAMAFRLQRLGIHTIDDLLEHFPLRYEDRSRLIQINQLRHGDFATFTATVERGDVQRVRGKSLARVFVQDEQESPCWSGSTSPIGRLPGKAAQSSWYTEKSIDF